MSLSIEDTKAIRDAGLEPTASIRSRPNRTRSWREFVRQLLGLLQIDSIEAFGEPAIDRREKVVGLSRLALSTPEPRNVRRRPELPGLRILPASNLERAGKESFRFRLPRGRKERDLSADSVRFGLMPPLVRRVLCGRRLGKAGPRLVEMTDSRIGSREMGQEQGSPHRRLGRSHRLDATGDGSNRLEIVAGHG